MSQYAWSAFTQTPADRHLVVVEVSAAIAYEPAPLIQLLIQKLEPGGDFALSSEKSPKGMLLFCAFALASDADMMVEALSAREQNEYPGWASQHHCRLDQATVDAITDMLGGTPDRSGAGAK